VRRVRHFLLALVLALAVLSAPAHALTPTDEFYVNDYAGILSLQTSYDLCQRGIGLYQENGVQVVVVIVNNYIGESMDAYANKVFNDFGIGSKKDNNGVLLILAVDDGEVRIEVGDGLSGQIPASKAGRILDDLFVPAAKEGHLETAIYRTYLQLIQEGSRLDTGSPPVHWITPDRFAGSAVGLLLVAVGVAFIIAASRQKRRGYGGYGGPSGPDGGPPAGSPPYSPRERPDPTTEGQRPAAQGGGFPLGPLIIRELLRHGRAGTYSPAGRERASTPSSRPGSPRPPSTGGGGRSSGGGASRGFPFGGFGRSGGSGSSGGFGGGGRSLGGGGRSLGGGGRSSGGGAGRGFKK